MLETEFLELNKDRQLNFYYIFNIIGGVLIIIAGFAAIPWGYSYLYGAL
jgi:hypothetical protein